MGQLKENWELLVLRMPDPKETQHIKHSQSYHTTSSLRVSAGGGGGGLVAMLGKKADRNGRLETAGLLGLGRNTWVILSKSLTFT